MNDSEQHDENVAEVTFHIPDIEDGPVDALGEAVKIAVYAAYLDPVEGSVDDDGRVAPDAIVDRVTAWLTKKFPHIGAESDLELLGTQFRRVGPWVDIE